MKDRSKKLLVINTGKKGDQEGVFSASVNPSVAGGAGMALPGNLSDYLLKSIWDRVWEIKTDNQGNEYIFGKLPVVTQYGITMYADGGELNLPSIYAGIPFDNKTIWLNPETGKVEVIGGTGGGVADSVHWNNIEGKPSFSAVATSGKYADLSGLPDLSVYTTTEYLTSELEKYVTLNTDQTIGAQKDFLNGLSVGGLGITKSQDDVIYLDANLVVRGGITMFGTNSVDVPTIMDAIATDEVNLKVVDGVLTFVGSSGGGLTEVYWDDVIGKPTLLSSFIDDVGYLKTSGGQITGNIGYTLDMDSYIVGVPAAGFFTYTYNEAITGTYLSTKKSFIGSAQYLYNDGTGGSDFYNVISVRHRNGESDGNLYGMVMYSRLNISNADLVWNRQANGTWQGERVILDSHNWSNYVSVTGSQTYNGTLQVNGENWIGGYPAVRWHIANVHWAQLLMRGDGTLELRNGASQDSWLSNLDLGTLYAAGNIYGSGFHGWNASSDYTSDYRWALYQWGDELQFTKRNSDDSFNSHLFVCNLKNGQTTFNSGINLNAVSGRPSLGYLSGGMLSVGLIGSYGTHIWTEGSGMGCIQVGRSDGSAVAYMLAIQPLGGETHICGNLLTYGGITMYSDIRKKTKLQDVELTLQQIADAPLIEHYYNSDTNKTTHVGSIAQYWASMNDWFCKLDSEGFYTMEIQNAALASAISIARELVKYESKTDKEIRLLKDEVKRLKKEIKILKSA